MLPVLLVAAGGAAAQEVSPAVECSSYVGQTPAFSAFEEIFARLPEIAPRGPYESTSEYELRLARAAQAPQTPVIVRIAQRYHALGLDYNADRRQLTIYQTAFGNEYAPPYNMTLAWGPSRVSARWYQVAVRETGSETYQATNGFGAAVTVTRTLRNVSALWELAEPRARNSPRDVPRGHSVTLEMTPQAAEELIERGGTALLFTPAPPFRTTGHSSLEPSFNRPEERQDSIQVIAATVQCGFLLDGAGRVTRAFRFR